MIVKTDVPGLVKDLTTGAILNADNDGLAAYKKTKQFVRERMEDKARLAKVESDLAEIKQLLMALARDRLV